jgi:hypothetical protein
MSTWAWARVLGAVALVWVCTAQAAAEDEFDDVLGGFEDEEEGFDVGPSEGSDALLDRAWELSGSAMLGTSLNTIHHRSSSGTNYTGLRRLRSRLNLQLDVDLPRDWTLRVAGFGFYDWAYLAAGRGKFTADVRNEYEWEFDFQDVYLQGSITEDFDLKLGRQVVNWGRSDTLRVIDVLNPLDNREPGLTDIEDLRRPVTMARADYYFDWIGAWSLTGIVIPELRFDLSPPFGSDFYPDVTDTNTAFALGGPALVDSLPEGQPREFHGNSEYAFALSGIFSGWDASFHFARVWNDRVHLEPGLRTLMPVNLNAEFKHGRYDLFGTGGNYTIGSWLFKTEVAYLRGVDYTLVENVFVTLAPGGVPIPVELPTHTEDKDRLDAMLGIEYYGFTDVTIALEVANRHIFNFDDRMRAFFAQPNALETALRITASYLNDRLELTALGIVFGERAQDGSMVRLQAQYDLRDALVLTGGILMFQEGDLIPFNSIAQNDRVFLELKYSF